MTEDDLYKKVHKETGLDLLDLAMKYDRISPKKYIEDLNIYCESLKKYSIEYGEKKGYQKGMSDFAKEKIEQSFLSNKEYIKHNLPEIMRIIEKHLGNCPECGGYFPDKEIEEDLKEKDII